MTGRSAPIVRTGPKAPRPRVAPISVNAALLGLAASVVRPRGVEPRGVRSRSRDAQAALSQVQHGCNRKSRAAVDRPRGVVFVQSARWYFVFRDTNFSASSARAMIRLTPSRFSGARGLPFNPQ
jgi:hypothetical protein